MAALVAVIGYGGMQVSSGELTAGALVAFILYLFQIIMPMYQITSFSHSFKIRRRNGTDDSYSCRKEEDIQTGKAIENADQPIKLEQVSFGYKTDQTILKDITATIEAKSPRSSDRAAAENNVI